MIPLILISKDSSQSEKFIENFIQSKKFLHYSIFKIMPLKSELSIDQVRQVKQELITSAHFDRLIILYEFHTAAAEVQNALLKTLEEKTQHNQFILVSHSEDSVLPTIRSRSKTVRLDQTEKDALRQEVTTLIKKITEKDYQFLSSPLITGITREAAILFMDELILYFRTTYSTNSRAVEIIKKVLYYKNLLITNNLNPQLTIDNVLIFMHKMLSMK